jgi:cytochrome c-type biogenesis protein CcmH
VVLWIILGGMTVAVVALLAAPFLRPRAEAPAPAAYDVEVYRDQLKEVTADEERGLVAADEAAAARLEIERRLLKAAERAAATGIVRRRAGVAGLLAVALGVPVISFILYARLGSPELPDRPFAERAGETQVAARGAKQAEELSRLADKLASKLKEQPDNLDGWMLLGRTYMETNRYADGVAAFEKAASLAPQDADVKVSTGEAMIYAAEGVVTPAARAQFEAARAIEPNHAGALYYLALGAWQSGDKKGAYDQWVKLGRETPPEAPYLKQVQDRVDVAAAELGITPEKFKIAPPPAAQESPTPNAPAASAPTQPPVVAGGAPGPSASDVQAAQQMSPEDRQAMIRGMVQRLADRLAQNPDDLDGWTRLGRAYSVLGERGKAAEAWGKAAALAPGDAAVQAEWDKARAAAGNP